MTSVRWKTVVLLSSLLAPMSVAAAQVAARPTGNPDWKADIERRRAALIAKNGPGTDAALRDQLLMMRDTDQKARGMGKNANGQVQIATNLTEVDNTLTEQLKAIVNQHSWPTISLVGIDASNAAMLVLTHTRDHAWQAKMLPLLVDLADEKKIDAAALALVVDKELVYEGKLQRYGTQFKQMDDGTIAMYSVEDPGGLDRERSEVMLPPIDVYKQMMAQTYQLKVSNKIAMAVAQKP